MSSSRDEDKKDFEDRSHDPHGAADRDSPEFSIDFETFQRSEQEIVGREPAWGGRGPARDVAAPQRRAVVARNWLPPGDSIVESRPVGSMTVVTLRGRINEAFRGAELGQSLRGNVVFDLSHVDRISSFGVKGWLQMMERARFSSCYLFRCSEAVIHQITMMRNFCGTARIHSLLVPYQCGVCGEEFSPVYEAVADRDLLRGRSPVPVECPRCGAAASMVEDPWAYLSLDDHLLDVVPPELQQVVDYLVQPSRTDALEKFVSERETRIRIHAPLDGRLRLSRALGGLEGRVVFDLSPRPDASEQAAERLVEAIRQLDDDVSEVWIDGANRSVIEALLANPVPRTYVSTAFVHVITPGGGRRPVLVDVRRKRAALLRGESPVVEGPGGARGVSQIEDGDVIYAAARQLVPAGPKHRTNTYTSESPVEPRRATPPMRTSPPPPPAIPARPAVGTWSVPSWQLITISVATVSLAALVFVVMFAIVLRGMSSGAGGGQLTTAQNLWSDGRQLPPSWAESKLTVDPDGVRATGTATAPTVDQAADRSRRVAVYHMVQHIARLLATGPVGPALGEDPGEVNADMVADVYLSHLGEKASPVRVDYATKTDPVGTTVATRHLLDAAALNQAISYYNETYEYTGVTVARRFPFHTSAPSEVVVVNASTWLQNVSPGDPVIAIGDTPIQTFEEYMRVAPRAYQRASSSMQVWILHEGRRTSLDIQRNPPQPKPEPVDPKEIDLQPWPNAPETP